MSVAEALRSSLGSRLRSYTRRLSRLWHRATWSVAGAGLAWACLGGGLWHGTGPRWLAPGLVLLAFTSGVLREIFELFSSYASKVDVRVNGDALHFKSMFRQRVLTAESLMGVIETSDGSFVIARGTGEVLRLESPSDEVRDWLRSCRDPLGAFELEGAPDGRGVSVFLSGTVMGFLSAWMLGSVSQQIADIVGPTLVFLAAASISFFRANQVLRVAADGIRIGNTFIGIHELKSVTSSSNEVRIALHSGKTRTFRLPWVMLRGAVMHRIREFMVAHQKAPAEVPALLERREDEDLQEWVRRLARAGRSDEYRAAPLTAEMAASTARDTRAPLQVRIASLAAMEEATRQSVGQCSADPRMQEAIDALAESPDALAEWLVLQE